MCSAANKGMHLTFECHIKVSALQMIHSIPLHLMKGISYNEALEEPPRFNYCVCLFFLIFLPPQAFKTLFCNVLPSKLRKDIFVILVIILSYFPMLIRSIF